MTAVNSLPFASDDPRWLAFRSPKAPEVFHSVVSTHHIWKADPFDVESIHAEARDVFARTVARINNAEPDVAGMEDAGGKILLLRGESGSGKTHLMRAFRHYLHSRGLGWFAYLQMTTSISNYPLYALRNVAESLSEPYDLEGGATGSGWQRLSNFLAEHPSVPAELRTELREGDRDNCPDLVFRMADCLLEHPHFARAQVDLDVMRAVLFFQRCEPAFAKRAYAYLRCDPLTDYDTRFLGGIRPRTATEDPLDMLVQIGRLTNLFERQALVLCLDQLEEIWSYGTDAAQRFRDAMSTVCALTDKHPGALVVIACLDELYAKFQELIASDRAMLDRIEREAPTPQLLRTNRSQEDVEQMIARRLDALYQSQNVDAKPEESLFPFDPADLAKLANLRPRGVLLACREARERSVRTGEKPRIGEIVASPISAPDTDLPIQEAEGRWNDFRNSLKTPPPDQESALATLLAWAVEKVNAELNLAVGEERFAAKASHTFVQIDPPQIPDAPRRWLVGVCNAGAAGGKLSRQIAELTAAAQGAQPSRIPVAVRSTAFPGGPRTLVAKQVVEMIKQGGWRGVIEDAEWRTLHALREFLTGQPDSAVISQWLAAEKPLSRLPNLRKLLLLDKLPVTERPVTVPPPEPEPKPTPEDLAPPAPDKPVERTESVVPPPPELITLGRTREAVSKPVVLHPNELTRHTAFLGGTGSGKTTAALALIENLLLRGIPAILLDRKGDLASYAHPDKWAAPLLSGHDAEAAARRRQLRERVEARLYTPGSTMGRPLGISLLPRGAGALPGPEREAAARAAAASLGAMMNYRTTATAPRLAVLNKAIETLAELEPEAEMTLRRLVDFIASEDDSLVNAIGHLESKLFKKLLQDLATFQVVKGHLLAPGGERVNAERLLGIGGDDPSPAGKTRLSIISTKFFDDTAGALFWTAQFLLEMGRFAAKHPSTALQGVVLFDEADLYLPATGKPVTKEPMENALRRWRSAGLGVMLASQSPGDFDYKCRENVRNWFIGKVKEDTALKKMRPMLKEAKTDIAAKLPALSAGQFFMVRENNVESLASARSLMDAQQVPDEEIQKLASSSGSVQTESP